MNFKINEYNQIKNRVIQLSQINIFELTKEIFQDPSLIFFITKNDNYWGIINKNSVLSENFIDTSYPVINDMEKINEFANIAIGKQLSRLPIIKDNKLVGECEIIEKITSLFSMSLERWNTLYSQNTIISDYLKYKKYSKIFFCGDFAKNIYEYTKSYLKDTKLQIIDDSLQTFLQSTLEENSLIIDTNSHLEKLKHGITSFQCLSNHYVAAFTTLYELCNQAELYFYVHSKLSNQAFYFVFPNTDKFTNLSLQEQYRISFDHHYRYYYNHMDNPEIEKLVKKVFGTMYSEDFIKSRNELSGLEFKNGVCSLVDSKNPLCRAFNGIRFTTDKTMYYKHCICMFGACTVYGATVDDQHTLASSMQRLINENKQDYEMYNYGARNLSIYESLRILRTLHLTDDDKIIFLLLEEEQKQLEFYNVSNIFSLEQFFNSLTIHDYFLDEPMHCNHICMELLAKFIYSKIKNQLIMKGNSTQKIKVQLENEFKNQINSLENQIKLYQDYLRQFKVEKDYCSIVLMHANPFTLGHYKLVEYASKHSDHVFAMLALNDGMFAPDDVYEMAVESCKNLTNVTVIKDRTDIIPRTLFLPGYFERDDNPDVCGNTLGFIDFIGTVIKPALNIKERFLGSEPVDKFTQKMNEDSAKYLPKYGIKSTEIPRFENEDGIPYSAKTVRNALKRKDWTLIKKLVPPATEKILHKYEDML